MNFKDILNKYLKKQDVDEKFQSGFALRFLDPANKKRFAIAFKTQKDADDKAAQLKRDGVKDITITKHDLNFKEGAENDRVRELLQKQETKGLSNSEKKELRELIKTISEESPANATGTAVAGTGDDSSTVVVRKKKKKELQSKLMKRLKIKESIDKAIPDLVEEEDEIEKRKNQLKELAKNNA